MCLVNQKTFISLAIRDSNHFANPPWDTRKENEINYVCGGSALAHPLRRARYEEFATENWGGRTSLTPEFSRWPHRRSVRLGPSWEFHRHDVHQDVGTHWVGSAEEME